MTDIPEQPPVPSEQRIPVSIEEEIRRSYLDYAMSVIVGRALPDVRDGLKPVHRRVLYGMWEQGNRHNRPYKKSARIVGDVMGKYHPHGDASIYDTAVRMAQDFSMSEPLVDGQGNFGSVDGDSAAAMRYTEVRLTALAEELVGEDIDKETVDWSPNYDGSLQEPNVLPAKFPNLLVNGAEGIAVGMATKIPPHNLREACDAAILLLEKPDAGLDELLRLLPGPDFPTGGILLGRRGVVEAYRSGRGIIQVRGRAEIEASTRADRESIVITEIPFQVNKARLIEQIADLVNEKRLEGISAIRDESDRDGMRVVVDLKKGENANVLLNRLYQLTPLQSSFGIIFLAIVEGQPRVLPLKEMLRHFLDHRRQVVVRRTRFDLAKAEARSHILLGLALALSNLDRVIAIIRGSKDPEEAKRRLTEEVAVDLPALMTFLDLPALDLSPRARRDGELVRLDEVQAQAILEMRLQRLTGLEREKIVAEYKDVLALIADLKDVLARPERVAAIIRAELTDIRTRFGCDRRTEISTLERDLADEDLIKDEAVVLTVTRGGYAKSTPLSVYREQKRGGKGRTGAAATEEDVVEHLFVASTHDSLLVFTDRGRVHCVRVWDVPSAGPAARGKALVNLIQVEPGDTVAAMTTTRGFPEDRFLLFATKRGLVKKTVLSAYGNVRDEARAREEDRPLRLRQRPRGGDHRDQPRGGRRAALRPGHRRRLPGLPRDAQRHGDQVHGDRRAADGPRHDGREGDRAARGGRGRRDGPRRRGGDAPRRDRARLRQADGRLRVSPPDARGLGGHQRARHGEERGRRRDQVRRRRRPAPPHHEDGDDDPLRRRRSPRDGPRGAGGEGDRPRRGRRRRRRREARLARRAGRGP